MYSLIRDISDKDGTLGRFLDPLGNELCKTLERPWNNNKRAVTPLILNDSSCIPDGIYKVRRYSSKKFLRAFEIYPVNNRDKILIHSANHIGQLLGCVGVGKTIMRDFTWQGAKHRYWLTQSGTTLKKLLEILPDEFELEIRS